MPKRPNVLLICVDHWPGTLLRAVGHPAILTPTLDQLWANGIVYTNAYTSTPTCVPSRRELMTGVFSPTHGDRVFAQKLPMPDLPTMAQTFRDAGYQAYAVGKMHVYPQRDRIGFDDVVLNEEGRHHLAMPKDDYEIFLNEQGYAGQEHTHGMGNNDYGVRPWHLPEHLHPTYWTVREMCKIVVRRDPTKPAFWYMSFNYPHPPLVPPAEYLDMYQHIEVDMPYVGEWAQDFEGLPRALRLRIQGQGTYPESAVRLARQAFYAQCTYIDHQIRLAIGTLREEGILDDTIIAFTSDHGDMLGNHHLYAKDIFYEYSARLPLVLVPQSEREELGGYVLDDRLAAQADIMPTLLELCDIRVPDSVEGLSLIGNKRHEYLYGEHWDDERASRMIRKDNYKLIYYPVGDRIQLFDLEGDPKEMYNLADDAAYKQVRIELTDLLVGRLYGSDLEWVKDGKLVGLLEVEGPSRPPADRGLNNQRGWRFR